MKDLFLHFFEIFITTYGTAMGLGPLIQGIRIWRRKKSGDVSLFSLNLIGFGCLFWLIWGLLSINIPLIVANSFACVAYAFAIILAFYYRNYIGNQTTSNN